MVNQCQLWVNQGLFQNQYCVLASFCYAQSTTDVLLRKEYPFYISPIPTSLSEERLSLDVGFFFLRLVFSGDVFRLLQFFFAMTNGSATMSHQNVIDAYYAALVRFIHPYAPPGSAHEPQQTGTWTSLGGPFGAETPSRTNNNGPYPTS